MSPRLSLALEGGQVSLPESGPVAVFLPRADSDLSALPKDRVIVVQPYFPDFDALARAGFECVASAEDLPAAPAASVVFLPRAKARARAVIAEAAGRVGGPVLIDGAKTDGIDSVLKDLRRRTEIGGPVIKAHGKLFWIDGGVDLSDWRAPARQEADGFVTAPGLFSADAIDPGSRLLAGLLPARLGRHVADLGAGWGYLSAAILRREDVETLDLVEADRAALDCARQNVTDPRARFHWADALRWRPETRLDTVVSNPPFHTGRAAEPDLGRAFIAAAAEMLAPSGQLWLVANRHLAYEAELGARFQRVEEAGGDARYKVIHATRPRRRTRLD